MATHSLTALTPEELAEKFPITGSPFAVWYSTDPKVTGAKWAVNDFDGEAVKEFDDLATALRAAADMGAEWDAEAKKQARALAEILGSVGDKKADFTVLLKSLIAHSYEFSNHLAAFSALAEELADKENTDEMDKLKFLLKSLKDRHFEFSRGFVEIEEEVSHA